MRTIAIDFNNPIEYENMVIGNIGEHNATEIILTPPSKIADCEAVKSYIVAFVVGGMVIHSEPFSKTETLSVKLWKQLTEEPVMGIQLEAYDENENFIGKSDLISSLRLSPSACGDDTVADTDNPDILSAVVANTSARHSHSNKSVLDRITRANMENVAANTLARHTHANIETLDKLGETNGNLTYRGKEVGSGGSGGSGGKDEIYIGSGEMPEGYVLQIDPEGTADSIPTKTSQLINDSGFITVKDLPNPELPSVTEADNGKVLRVVNGVWDKDEIPAISGGSVIGEFELIEEIVIAESIAGFKRDVEPDGTPYDFKGIYVQLFSPSTNGVHGGRFYFFCDYENLFSPPVSFTAGNDYISFGVAELFGRGIQIPFLTKMSRSDTDTPLSIYQKTHIDKHINKIEFKIPTNESVLMKDDVIKIYGVRW